MRTLPPALLPTLLLAVGCGADTPEVCGNGVDDDGNGLADCAEAMCAPLSQCDEPDDDEGSGEGDNSFDFGDTGDTGYGDGYGYDDVDVDDDEVDPYLGTWRGSAGSCEDSEGYWDAYAGGHPWYDRLLVAASGTRYEAEWRYDQDVPLGLRCARDGDALVCEDPLPEDDDEDRVTIERLVVSLQLTWSYDDTTCDYIFELED